MMTMTPSEHQAVADVIDQIIPTWLQDSSVPDPDPRFPRTKVEKELREHNLACLFERILDGMCEGNSARAIIILDHNRFKVGDVMRWILTDPTRKRRYDEAEAIRAVVENDLVNDLVTDETADPAYKKERVEWHKWRASKANREKFGDKTTVEMNVTKVDIRALIEKRERAIAEVSSGNIYDAE